MSGFDTLSRGKKRPETQKSDQEEIVRKNINKKSYKDIHKKRKPVIQIKPPKEFSHKKKITPEEKIIRVQETIKQFGHSLKKRHIGIIVIVLFLSFVVYGVGFILRTERTIKSIITSPEQYASIKNIRKVVYTLWQDYQILGIIADNSPLPIEPLTSYGKILKNTRLLTAQNDNIRKMATDIIGWKNVSETESIFPLLDNLWDIAEESKESVESLAQSLFTIAPPEEGLQEKYKQYIGHLDAFLKHKKIWYNLLGKERPTRILILNQNNDELRAGGGFPGTVFVVEFENGKIKDISFYDIYELDYSITEYISPPEGINQLRSIAFPGRPVELRIRDANYYPTFAESAEKIHQLTSLSKIGPVDLIIGINTDLLSDILEITGPIKVPGVPMKLNKENNSLVLSMLVEAKEKIHDIPKGVISILGDTLMNVIIEKQKTGALTKILWKNLEKGEILLASPHDDIQYALDDLQLFDTWKTRETDFIYPLFTSISKNKSDRIMTRDIIIQEIDTCTRKIILKQKHGWNVSVESQIKKMAHDLNIVDRLPLLLPIQGSGDNKQYIRFVLPKGSTLIGSSKTQLKKIETQYDETIIDGYITTPTGLSSSLEFSYTLPKNLCGTKTHFFKQAGLKNITVRTEKDGNLVSQKVF